MSILDAFTDWMQVTAQHKIPVTTLNAAGQPVRTFSDNGSPFKCGKWTNASNEILLNSSFEDQEIGNFIINPEEVDLNFNQGDKFAIGSLEYDIIGVDDTIGVLGEVILLTYRREYGKRA